MSSSYRGISGIEGRLEYLWGNNVFWNLTADARSKDFWAHDKPAEKKAFIGLYRLDLFARWRQDLSMHVYHYAAYRA